MWKERPGFVKGELAGVYGETKRCVEEETFVCVSVCVGRVWGCGGTDRCVGVCDCEDMGMCLCVSV